jgi:ABC-type multidrug transport system fused ATPase/permease subunit
VFSAQLANANLFIHRLPQGYQTVLIERGTHTSLLAQKGFYHHLYMSQFKGQATIL